MQKYADDTVLYGSDCNALQGKQNFTKRFNISNRETRQAYHFHIPMVVSAHTQSTIYYNGPVVFNKLCTSMNLNCAIHTFKKHLKKKLS